MSFKIRALMSSLMAGSKCCQRTTPGESVEPPTHPGCFGPASHPACFGAISQGCFAGTQPGCGLTYVPPVCTPTHTTVTLTPAFTPIVCTPTHTTITQPTITLTPIAASMEVASLEALSTLKDQLKQQLTMVETEEKRVMDTLLPTTVEGCQTLITQLREALAEVEAHCKTLSAPAKPADPK